MLDTLTSAQKRSCGPIDAALMEGEEQLKSLLVGFMSLKVGERPRTSPELFSFTPDCRPHCLSRPT